MFARSGHISKDSPVSVMMECIIANSFLLWGAHLCQVQCHALNTLDSCSYIHVVEGYTIYLLVMFSVYGPLLFL